MARINTSTISAQMVQLSPFGQYTIKCFPKPTMSAMRATFSIHKTTIATYEIPSPYPTTIRERLHLIPKAFPSGNWRCASLQDYMRRTMRRYSLIVHSAIGASMKGLDAIRDYATSFHGRSIT